MKLVAQKIALEKSPGVVIATTPGGEILYWSKSAEALFGYSAAEAIGRNIHDLIIFPDQAEREKANVKEALQSGTTTYQSMRHGKDGQPFPVEISLDALRLGTSTILIRTLCDIRTRQGVARMLQERNAE